MKKNKKRKPVSPIYAFGAVFLMYSVFFNLLSRGGVVKCLLIAWAVSSLVKSLAKKDRKEKTVNTDQPKSEAEKKKEASKPEASKQDAQKDEPKSTGNPELDAVIRQGRYSVKRIQEINDDIPDYKISAQLKQIEILTASVIDQVERKEDKLKQVRQFMNYYLPTTIKLLEQYVQLQNVGLRGENISAAMTQIEEMLDKVIVAFQKQLDSLFERDVVDITADIQVMEQMMAAQGLTEDDF